MSLLACAFHARVHVRNFTSVFRYLSTTEEASVVPHGHFLIEFILINAQSSHVTPPEVLRHRFSIYRLPFGSPIPGSYLIRTHQHERN